MISRSSHVAVVGGGVIGCAIAFRLAQAGVRVTVVERDPIGQNASGKNAGNLNPIFMTPPALVPMALESFRLHESLPKELVQLGVSPYTLEPVARILLGFDDAEASALQQVRSQFEGHEGFSTHWLDTAALRRLEPRLSPEARDGLLIEGNLGVDPIGLTRALLEGALRLRATFVHGQVREIQKASRNVTHLKIDDREVACDALVLSTGPWVDETKQWLGLSLPVEPVKGEMLRIGMDGKKLGYDLTHGSTSIYRRGDETWIGTTHERSGFNVETTEAAKQDLLAAARRILPELETAEVMEQTAALRPMTPSSLPILRKADGWDNVYLANGGGNKGVLLCTGMARALCDLMLKGANTGTLDISTH